MWSRPLRVWRDWKILKADEGKVFPFAGATDSIHSLKYSGELLGSTKTHQSKFCARGILFVIQIHTPAPRKSHGERTTSNDAQLVRGHRMRNGNANCALQSRGCALWFLRSGSVSSRAAWRGDAHFAGRSFFFYYFSSPLSLFSLFLRCHFSQPGGWADPSPGCLCGGSTSLSYNNLRESTRVCPPHSSSLHVSPPSIIWERMRLLVFATLLGVLLDAGRCNFGETAVVSYDDRSHFHAHRGNADFV